MRSHKVNTFPLATAADATFMQLSPHSRGPGRRRGGVYWVRRGGVGREARGSAPPQRVIGRVGVRLGKLSAQGTNRSQ